MTRAHLPDTRASVTRHFVIRSSELGEVDLYATVGLYGDGRPGEIFLRMAKDGSTLALLVDQWATAVSMLLQHGEDLDAIVGKFQATTFEPRGWVDPPIGEIRSCSSPIDLVVRWLGKRFGGE